MRYHVEITRVAAHEIARRYEALAADTKIAAERWRTGILAAIESLSEYPERCPQAPESEWYGEGLREAFYGKSRNTYRILFELRGTIVFILRVRHGRQDFLKHGDLRSPQ